MNHTTIGLLHPGAMGASIGRALAGSHRVLWAGEGRSDESRQRAVAAGLEDVGSVAALVAAADVVLSICPPSAALDLARDVKALGFDGIFVDANAVSPATSASVGEHFDRFVDGGIIGPPVNGQGSTRLYLSGAEAPSIAGLFDGSDLEVRLVTGSGSASAVKMCFASWTKGTSALLFAVRALAEAEGVDADLVAEWETSLPDILARSERSPAGIGPKAWRFEGEMNEIADTFEDNGLPGGFHHAAAEIYQRMASLKGREGATLDDVISRIRSVPDQPRQTGE